MTDASNRTDENIMTHPIGNPETEKPQLIDATLGMPDGPVVIGTGFKTLQEAWDAAVHWSAPERIESEARELHKTSCVGWMRWEQLGEPCKEEFRQNARKKLGVAG